MMEKKITVFNKLISNFIFPCICTVAGFSSMALQRVAAEAFSTLLHAYIGTLYTYVISIICPDS
jgi:hypothetical protein